MKVYRFRSDQNPEYTVDILLNRRLYCAHWRDLNDPMEGTCSTLVINEEHKRQQARQAIYNEKVKLRICSLSTTYKKHTMWAYYANGFKGLAIELEIDEKKLHRVDYASGARIQEWADGSSPNKIARDILTKKHSDWKDEHEFRLLHDAQYFQLAPGSIRGIILGSRIEKSFEQEMLDIAGDVPLRRLTIRSGRLYGAAIE